jgi:heterodisulfide reductase subunit A
VVIAACSPKTHEPFFRRVCLTAGLNPYLLEMVNLRNHNTWVHKNQREAAFEKALDMIRMGVDRARLLRPLESSLQPMNQQALVIGGVAGADGRQPGRQGYRTHLIEKGRSWAASPQAGHPGAQREAADLLDQKLRESARRRQVHLLPSGGSAGTSRFHARLSDGKR